MQPPTGMAAVVQPRQQRHVVPDVAGVVAQRVATGVWTAMREEEEAEARELHRIGEQQRRARMTQEQAAEARELHMIGEQQRRARMTQEQAAEARELHMIGEQQRRARMTQEAAEEERELNRIAHELRRARMDEEAADAERAADAEGHREARARDAVTAANLPFRFAERPNCVCSSCTRVFYCSRQSGSRPQAVGALLLSHGLLTLRCTHT
jgi:hypothetical protein